MQQIEAAGVAESFDLAEQMRHRDAGLGFAAPVQVVSVGVDQAGTILRRAAQLIR
ncbi:hypothetical protein GLP40_29165 [Nocardia sp. CT2-14]|uniref:Uncharacterized protein n=1 Tax=Nocardia aurantiaca TaxID=2675850 RepID=A0A6I3L770_9NOCA|nr:hypothetical protein [Nocardia aurantiaca]